MDSGANKVHNITDGSDAIEPSQNLPPIKPEGKSIAAKDGKSKIHPSINEETNLEATLGGDKIVAEVVETVNDPSQPRDRRKANIRLKSQPTFEALTVEEVLGE